jgi:prolyl oligopeptidase
MCPIAPPPLSAVEPVVDVLHGVAVTDPYRWLEDQNAPRTREWINEQTIYARAYLDGIAGRAQIRERVRELLDVETYDSFLKCGGRYFFRKRLPGQEQPSIYFRKGIDGEDQLLVDPVTRGTGNYTAVKPLRVSPDSSLLLYEVKQGGERTGTFEILDVINHKTLPDTLPHGYLRGFAFASDSKSFYYVHEATKEEKHFRRAVFQHVLGATSAADKEIFCAGEGEKLRVAIVFGKRQLAFFVQRFLETTHIDFYLWAMGGNGPAIPVVRDAEYSFAPRFHGGRILAVTDENAPNRRIVDVQPRKNQNPLYFNVIPETDAPIRNWAVTANHIIVSYARGTRSQIVIFDLFGKRVGEIPCRDGDTVRVMASSTDDDEILLERESFTRPIEIVRCSAASCDFATWARRSVPFDPAGYDHMELSFPSKDGTTIPLFLVGRRDVLAGERHPAIMTSYGGYGISATPQFSVLVAFLIEQGCLFVLPNIRGGSEFGEQWHSAAKRRNRQVAFDDFIAAADWLVGEGRTETAKLAIFGGSNSGLLVGAAMTQRPDLFRAVLCMVPMLDMLRYHRFDSAHVWKEEFGTADDAEDFAALVNYSPYHSVRNGVAYPATMIVSGDADGNCNPLHARKMAASLQAANTSVHPILLDYSTFRGHSPVLPLSVRIEALTDRMAFLSEQLGLATGIENSPCFS